MINKTIVCPICGKKTWLRIQNGGYLEEYPIRVNCKNCKALLKGIFITSSSELLMQNAATEEITPPKCTDADALLLTRMANVSYVAEISGELPCRHVYDYVAGIPESPYLTTATQLESGNAVINRIKRLEHFQKNLSEWKDTKSIAFQLLSEGSIKYLAIALHNKMGQYKYDCTHYLKSLHCLQQVIIEESKYLFYSVSQTNLIKELLDKLSQVDKKQLHGFVEHIGGIEVLITEYRRSVEIFSNFMSIYQNVLPAETFVRLNNENTKNTCISTCSFSDIKSYYLDSSEALTSLLYIPICLDNCLMRGDYQEYDHSIYQHAKHPEKAYRLKDYNNISHNSEKLKKISLNEPFQSLVNISYSVKLRNCIGHNNYKYDSIQQIITLYDLNKKNKKCGNISLMSVAIECINMAKSSVILSEILLYLVREELRLENIKTIIHPEYYKNLKPNDKCPCGSNLKFKKCCMPELDSNHLKELYK